MSAGRPTRRQPAWRGGFSNALPATATVDLILPDLVGIARGKRLTADGFASGARRRAELPELALRHRCDRRQRRRVGPDLGAGRRRPALPGRPDDLRAGALAARRRAGAWRARRAGRRAVLRRSARAACARRGALRARSACSRSARSSSSSICCGSGRAAALPRPPRVLPRADARSGLRPRAARRRRRFPVSAADYCAAQDLPAKGAVSEYAPGQFEVNLGHVADPLRAADQAFLLKRAIKAAARADGLQATFMAKPFAERSANGLHVHVSLRRPRTAPTASRATSRRCTTRSAGCRRPWPKRCCCSRRTPTATGGCGR